jgi:hypothetical protein
MVRHARCADSINRLNTVLRGYTVLGSAYAFPQQRALVLYAPDYVEQQSLFLVALVRISEHLPVLNPKFRRMYMEFVICCPAVTVTE